MSTARHVRTILSAWGIPAAIVLASVAVLSDQTSLSLTANHLVYDRFVKWDAQLNLVPAQVLLVYADRQLDEQPDRYEQLLGALRDLGANGVGIVQLDARRWSPAQLQRLTDKPGVVVGQLLTDAATALPGLSRADTILASSSDGVYRSYPGRPSDGGAAPLAIKLAQSFGRGQRPLPPRDFGVRFCGSAESLPHVTAEAVLADEITAALVRDRVVLIGRPLDASSVGITTPTTAGSMMSVLEFHGQALNTLLVTRPLTSLPPPWQWPLFGLAAIALPAVARRMRLGFALPLFVAVWTAQTLLAWLMLWRLQIWIPLVSLMFVEGAAVLVNYDLRLRFSERSWQILRRRGFHVSPRYQNPPSLNAEQAPWPYITAMLQQLFPLNHVALLLVRPGSERLECVTCTGDQPPDVLTCRQELHRPPFDDALQRRAATRIDADRPYFPVVKGQAQYFVPLLHAGQLQAVLIVELSAAALDNLPGFAKQLTRLSEELATWCARYERLAAADRWQRQWGARWTHSAEVATFERLQVQLRSTERRLHQADQVVEHASFGQAVFSLSGAVVTMNATMYRLLSACNIPPFDSQLLQVIRTLTRRDMPECRELVRRVVIHQLRERIVVTDPGGEYPLVLVVQPSLRSEQLADDPAELHAFSVQGVYVELFPGDLLGEIHAVREHMTEQSLTAVQDSLATLSSLASELEDSMVGETWQQMNTSIDRARGTIELCQSMLANGRSEELDVQLPVEVATIVRAAVTETRVAAEQQGKSITTDVPSDLPDVIANPQRLRQVISTTIGVMVDNSQAHSLIHLSARSQLGRVIITIKNEGCGLALDRLTQSRLATSDESSSEISRLIRLREWMQGWGGDLLVDSELGEGASIRLSLRHFSWSDLHEQLAAAGTSRERHLERRE